MVGSCRSLLIIVTVADNFVTASFPLFLIRALWIALWSVYGLWDSEPRHLAVRIG